jgi:hypothetical protein
MPPAEEWEVIWAALAYEPKQEKLRAGIRADAPHVVVTVAQVGHPEMTRKKVLVAHGSRSDIGTYGSRRDAGIVGCLRQREP